MAAMTRAEMVTELQARGWSRYTSPQLQKYLDWALQEVYRRSNFDAVKPNAATATLAQYATNLTFVAASGGTANIVSIESVNLKDAAGYIVPLETATEEKFFSQILPNDLTANTLKTLGKPTHYYVWSEKVYFWPAPDVGTYVWYITSTIRLDAFGGDVVSGLPERLDPAILAFAEMICNRRARDYESMAVAEAVGQGILDSELATERRAFTREYPRIVGYHDD